MIHQRHGVVAPRSRGDRVDAVAAAEAAQVHPDAAELGYHARGEAIVDLARGGGPVDHHHRRSRADVVVVDLSLLLGGEVHPLLLWLSCRSAFSPSSSAFSS